jgi:hypothetical protein
MEGAVNRAISRKYKDHWIRCVALPQSGPSGCWTCAVYVFVSEPKDDVEPADDTCFHTVLRNFQTEAGAVEVGLGHAQSIIDRRPSDSARA